MERGTAERLGLPGGVVAPHGGSGPLHLAFSVAAADLDAWRGRLGAEGVPIEGEASWPGGATSLDVRDPDGHLVEPATPGLRATYGDANSPASRPAASTE